MKIKEQYCNKNNINSSLSKVDETLLDFLLKSEESYRMLFESEQASVLKVDPDSLNIVDVNNALCHYYDLKREEIISQKIDRLLSLPDKKKKRNEMKNNTRSFFFVKFLRSDGKARDIKVYVSPVVSEERKLQYYLLHDITEHKITEEKLQLADLSLNSSKDAIFWTRSDGKFFYANKAACSLFGYSEDEFSSMTAKDIDPEFSEGKWPERWETARQEGSHTFYSRHCTKNGHHYPVEITINYQEYEGEEYNCVIIRDLTEHKKNEEALEAEAIKRRALIEQSADGIVIIDQDCKVFEANRRYADMLGYSPEEMLSLHMWDWDTHYTKEQLKEMTRLSDTVGVIHETKQRRKDGTLIDVEVSGSAVKFSDQKLIICVCRDITERKQTEEALLEAKQAAEDASRSKSEFLATMSHELRTPLNSIIGFSDMLLAGTGGELGLKQTEYIRHVSKSGKHLLQLINDILDFSKIEAGKMELHYEVFSLLELVQEVKMIIKPLAAKKSIYLEVNADTNIDINADRTKIRQILYNLTSNAIKFTPERGTVTIDVIASKETVQISIRDTGIGISRENTSKLFQPFKQLDEYTTRQYEGTGLGLAIVKKYVEMHGGNIWVQSKQGEGSTFAFVIPVEPLDEIKALFI